MILNSHLPVKAWINPQTARLPGVQPVSVEDWLYTSDQYEAQMAYRHDLLASQTEAVFGVIDGSNEACAELRDLICKDKSTKPLADADYASVRRSSLRHVLGSSLG